MVKYFDTPKTITIPIYQLEQTSLNKEKDFNKLLELTNHDIADILIRFCNFHKIASTENKKITTSNINYQKKFIDYILNGYQLDFIPPIIYNTNSKEIEISSTSVVVKQLIK